MQVIHKVSETKTEDMESKEIKWLTCSKVKKGVKRWVKEIKLTKERAQSLKYQEKPFCRKLAKEMANKSPNISGMKN